MIYLLFLHPLKTIRLNYRIPDPALAPHPVRNPTDQLTKSPVTQGTQPEERILLDPSPSCH